MDLSVARPWPAMSAVPVTCRCKASSNSLQTSWQPEPPQLASLQQQLPVLAGTALNLCLGPSRSPVGNARPLQCPNHLQASLYASPCSSKKPPLRSKAVLITLSPSKISKAVLFAQLEVAYFLQHDPTA